MEIKRRNMLIGALLFCIALFMIFGGMQYREKVRYEKYISQVLMDEIATFSSFAIQSRYYMDQVIYDRQLTKDQFDQLTESFTHIFNSGTTLSDLKDGLLKLKEGNRYERQPSPFYMANSFNDFLLSLEKEFDNEHTLNLSEEHQEKFMLIYAVIFEWIKDVPNFIKGINDPFIMDHEDEGFVFNEMYRYYGDKMVKSNDWINFMNDIERASKEFQLEVEQAFGKSSMKRLSMNH